MFRRLMTGVAALAAAAIVGSDAGSQVPDWDVSVEQYGDYDDQILLNPNGAGEITIWIVDEVGFPVSGATVEIYPLSGTHYACPLDPNYNPFSESWTTPPTDAIGRTTISIQGSGCTPLGGQGWIFAALAGFELVEAASPDINQDGAVDTSDFVLFQNMFNTNNPCGDYNNSGKVDLSDFVDFQTYFLTGC